MDTHKYGDHKHNEDCEQWCDVAPVAFARTACPECGYLNGSHEQEIPQQHYTHCPQVEKGVSKWK